MEKTQAESEQELIQDVTESDYKYGFVTEVENETFPIGLNPDIIRKISAKKNEPDWMLQYRLKAYEYFLEMDEPDWANVTYTKPDLQAISYFSTPKKQLESLDDVDDEILDTFNKLGIPLEEQKALSGVAVDAVFDSVSVGTTFKDKLAEIGVIFCSFSEAVQDHPELERNIWAK